jgi:predicted permease
MSACLVLLVVSGLLIRSLLAAERIDLGFRPGGVLNVGIDIAHVAYDRAQRGVLFDRVEEALRAIPGVDDVAFADTVPLGYIWLRNAFEAEAAPPTTGPRPEAGINSVSANYFRVMGIPLIDGRGFDDEETGTVAVVNERFAEMMWPGQGAVGRRFRTAGTATYIDVIGVTHTGKYNFIFEDPQPYVYFPFDRAADAGVRTIHVHTTRLTPERLAPGVERAIRAIEPEIVLFDVMSMQRALGGGFGFFIVRTAALFAVILGLLAVVLALVGLYGVMAYTVSRRTHEIGVRMAVGAARRDVARLVLAEGTVLIANGIVVGLPLSILSSGLVARFLVNVSPHDPLTYISVVVLLAAAALGACAIPAWRAARLEPLAALRDA